MTESRERRTDGGVDESASFVEYGIEDKPPLGQSVLLGLQHYLTMVGATVAIPLALAGALGMFEAAPNQVGRLIGTFFLVSGVATLAQTTIGNRYPIVQGGTFAMLAPALAIISVLAAQGAGWQVTLRELQGAVIAAAVVQALVGYLGLVGALKRYLSPVVIAPVIVLIGISLFSVPQITDPTFAGDGTQNWWLLGLTLLLIVLFSQYLDGYSRMAKLYPVLLGVTTAWLVAAALSAVGFYGPDSLGYVDFASITAAGTVQVITPFQWGMPRFTVPFIIGMFAGIVASIIESVGDYYAVARLSGMSAPSEKRINHGIGMEGLGNIFAGVMGTGNGSTSYSENIGAIGITGVASRYVVQIGAVVMIVAAFVAPFTALIATIPAPIVGGLFVAMFGQIAAVGLSNLKYVDLDSQRNVFIVGLALFAGLAVPAYMETVGGAGAFQAGMSETMVVGPLLGNEIASSVIFVIGSTGMAVGGIIAFVLDNTVPGTRAERGLDEWEAIAEDEEEFQTYFERLRSGSSGPIAATEDAD